MKNEDAQLVNQFLTGNENAFTTLVKKYQKSVHALAWRKIGDFHIAEELTQDTFLKAYEKLPTLKNPNQFAGWLYVIADRLCIDWHRKRKPPIESLETTSGEEIEASSYRHYEDEQRKEASVEHRCRRIRSLLEKLPESERTVVTLHYLGEMTYKAISEFLGVSPNTVQSRLQRARNRLRQEEDAVQETLGGVHLPTTFTENIMRQIADIKPVAPTSSKPIVPWAACAATAIFIFLIMGIGSEHLVHFQKPYTLNSQSETTVEIIDAPIVFDTETKPDLRTQVGRFESMGKSKSVGPQVSEPIMLAAAQVEKETRPSTKQQWVQVSGPTKGRSVSNILASSWGDVYAVSKIGIYRLTPDAPAWTLISPLPPEVPVNNHSKIIVERNNRLYLIFSNGVFASKDRGETWIKLGARPKGRAMGLVVMDDALYLALRDEGIFRSTDAGKQWTPLNSEIEDSSISAIAAVENTIFIGTNRGLYRLRSETWEKLPVTTKAIHALSVSGNSLYVGTGHDTSQLGTPEGRQAYLDEFIGNIHADIIRTWEVFRSTDLGDSWTDITPTSKSLKIKIPSAAEVFAAGDTILVSGAISSFRSTDGGKTWTESDTNITTSTLAAVDENTLFKVGTAELTRSTDGGESWHSFTNGLVDVSISNLMRFKNAIYTSNSKGVMKSIDGGESWKNLPLNSGELTLKRAAKVYRLISPKLAIADGGLYGAGATLAPVHQSRICRLSENGNVLIPIQGIPAVGEAPPLTDTKAWADITGQFEISPSAFAVSGKTFYVEHRRQLLRWKRGASEWFNTGLVDEGKSKDENDGFTKQLRLAVSEETVYAGKRDGSLLQSFDSGNTWKDLTSSLPLRFARFNDITFAGSTVYVATDAGVLVSENGEHWRAIVDKSGIHTRIDRIAVDTPTVYGASNEGVYRLNDRDAWEKILSEVPDRVVSLVINGDQSYIVTKRRGMFRISIEKE